MPVPEPAPPPEPPPYLPNATIKDLMLSIIDTNADVVWKSVSTVVSEQGVVETEPPNDDDGRLSGTVR